MANKFIQTIKKLFGHNNEKTIQEMGFFPLGGGWQEDNKYISTNILLTISDFNRCVQIIANDIATVEFKTQKLKNDKWISDSSNNLDLLLNRRPNSEMSGFEFKKWIVFNLFIYGAAAIFVNRDPITNKPIELLPVFRNYIKREVINGIPKYKITEAAGSTETSQNNKNIDSLASVYFDDEDIIWIPFETIDNIQNVEFRTLFQSTLNKIRENDASTLNAFKNDTGLSLFIKLKDAANHDQKRQVAEALRDSAAFMKKSGMLAFVYDQKMEISSNEKVLQSPISLDLRKQVVQELTAKFGIPASFLGIENYNQSTDQLATNYIARGILPVINSIISKLEYFFYRENMTRRINYSLVSLSGLSFKDKVAVLSQGVNAAIFTINEARSFIGLDPIPEGDRILGNSTLQPISLVAEKTEAQTNKLDAETENINNDKNLTNTIN